MALSCGGRAVLKQVLFEGGKAENLLGLCWGKCQAHQGLAPSSASTNEVPGSDADGRDSPGTVARGDREPGDTAVPCRCDSEPAAAPVGMLRLRSRVSQHSPGLSNGRALLFLSSVFIS